MAGDDRTFCLRHVALPDGRGQQAHEADGLRVRGLQPRDGGDGGVAGGEHRVEHDRLALVHALGHLEVVLDGLEGVRVAVEAHVAHARAGHDAQHAVEEPVARAHDAHEHGLLAVDDGALHGLERGLDVDQLGGHVPRDLVGHQHADLAQQAAEAARAAVLLAHQRELVLNQRVGDVVDVAHGALERGSGMLPL